MSEKINVEVPTVGTVPVDGGKIIEAKGMPNFEDGEQIIAFSLNERAKFKVSYPKEYPENKKKHVPEGTVIDMHVIDAAVAEKMGKGKIVK